MNRHVLSVVGPAGCGKGTCCTYLKGLGATVMTMSDVLEEYSKKNKAAGEVIREYKTIKKQNVPDSIVAEAMIWKLRPLFRQEHSGLFGLDGYGRGPEQIKLLADWIENRNTDYTRKERPLIKHGYVFLTLTFEETMKRVQKRVQEFLAEGKEPRSEDLGDHPLRRFEEYTKQEDVLISTARAATGQVHIIDLGVNTTLQAAATIYGTAFEVDPESIAGRLRASIQAVA